MNVLIKYILGEPNFIGEIRADRVKFKINSNVLTRREEVEVTVSKREVLE